MATAIEQTSELLSNALLQSVAESYLEQSKEIGGSSAPFSLERVLNSGNNNPSLNPTGLGATGLTPTQYNWFTSNYTIVCYYPNDITGFSATVFRNNSSGEYTISLRSTEFNFGPLDAANGVGTNKGGDWARDGGPGADTEISEIGFALPQIQAMEDFYTKIKAGNKWDLATKSWVPVDSDDPLYGIKSAETKVNVTGYSLGSDLATAFTILHEGDVNKTYNFNAAGIGGFGNNTGDVSAPIALTLGALLRQYREMMAFDGQDISQVNGKDWYQEMSAADRTAYIVAAQKTGDTLEEQNTGNPNVIIPHDYRNNIYERPLLKFVDSYLGRRTVGAGVGIINGPNDVVKLLKDAILGAGHADGMAAAQLGEKLRNYFASNDKLAQGLQTSLFSVTNASWAERVLQVNGHGDFFDPEFVANGGFHAPGNNIWIEDLPTARGLGILSLLDAARNWVGDFGETHSITPIIDSLTLMQIFRTIDSTITSAVYESIQRRAANSAYLMQGIPDPTKLNGPISTAYLAIAKLIPEFRDNMLHDPDAIENTVNALAKIFFGTTSFAMQVVDAGATTTKTVQKLEPVISATGYGNRTIRDALQTQMSRIQAALSGYSGLKLIDLTSMTALQLIQAANGDNGIAVRYALKELLPFAVGGNASLYTQFNTLHQLDKLDPTTKLGAFSDSFLAARAGMLALKLLQDKENTGYITGSGENYLYRDMSTNQYSARLGSLLAATSWLGAHGFQVTSAARDKYVLSAIDLQAGSTHGGVATHLFVFGKNGGDSIRGGNFSDSLFGGAGVDVITGRWGDDFLEGGGGADTYVLETGDGADTIVDRTGTGRIVRNGVQLTGATYHNTATQWQSLGSRGQITAIYEQIDNDLKIMFQNPQGAGTDSVLIKNFDFDQAKNGAGYLGIKLGKDISQSISMVAGSNQTTGSHSASLRQGASQLFNILVGAVSSTEDTVVTLTLDALNGAGFELLVGGISQAFSNGMATVTIPKGQNSIAVTLTGNSQANSGQGTLLASVNTPGTANPPVASGGNAVAINYQAAGAAQNVYDAQASHDFFQVSDQPAATQGQRWNITGSNGTAILIGGAGDDSIIGSTGGGLLTGGDGNDTIKGSGSGNILITAGGTGSKRIEVGEGHSVVDINAQIQFSVVTASGFGIGQNASPDIRKAVLRDLASSLNVQIDASPVTVTHAAGTNDYALNLLSFGSGGALIPDHGGYTARFENFSGTSSTFPNGGGGAEYTFQTDINNPQMGTVTYVVDGVTQAYRVSLNRMEEFPVSTDPVVIIGGPGNQLLIGGNGNAVIQGGSGNDTLIANGGNNYLTDGDGNDLLVATGSNNYLESTGSGNDTLWAVGGGNQLIGGSGHDLLIIGSDEIYTVGNYLEAGDGGSTLIGGSGDDELFGGQGDDQILIGSGNNHIESGGGNDSLGAQNANGNNTVVIDGSGTNQLYLGNGANTVTGGNGTDNMLLGNGNNTITAGYGRMNITAGNGNNSIVGGIWNDSISLGNGNNTVTGGSGTLYVVAGSGQNRFVAGSGNATFIAGDGQSTFIGGLGNTTMVGGNVGSVFTAGDGSDVIYGGSGNDTITAGSANNYLSGGDGDDTYIVNSGSALKFIVDSGGNDKLQLTGIASADARVFLMADSNDLFLMTGGNILDLTYGGGSGIVVVGGATGTVEAYEFSDGITLTREQLLTQSSGSGQPRIGVGGGNSGAGSTVQGHATESNLLMNLGGNVTLTGGSGNDTLVSGAMGTVGTSAFTSDTLIGGGGNDTFVINSGGSHFLTASPLGNNRIELNTVSSVADLQITLAQQVDWSNWPPVWANYLRIQYDAQGSAVYIRDGLLQGQNTYQLGDGTLLTQEELLANVTTPLNIIGSLGNQTLIGGGGNDVISGWLGHNILVGGAGADQLVGNHGDDTLVGGAGDDTLRAFGGGNLLLGGDGNDSLVAFAGANTLDGGAGINLLQGSDGDDVFIHNVGTDLDVIRDSGGANIVRFGAGISAADIHAELVSGDGDAIYLQLDYGTAETVLLQQSFGASQAGSYSFEFADGTTLTQAGLAATAFTEGIFFHGGAGGVSLVGTAFDDTLIGGTGNDAFQAGAGNDYLYGGVGADTLSGGSGNNTLYGGSGSDVITGAAGDSVIDGGTGADTITLGGGNNSVALGRGMGRDTIIKGSGTGVVNEFVIQGDVALSELRTQQIGNDLYVHLRNSSDGVLLQGYFDPAQNYAASTWQVKGTDGSVTSIADVIANQPADVRPASVQAAWQAFQERARNFYASVLAMDGYHADGNGNYVKDVFGSSTTYSEHRHYVASIAAMSTQSAQAGTETHRDLEVHTTDSTSNTTVTYQTTYGQNSGFKLASDAGYAGKSADGGQGGQARFVSWEDFLTRSASGSWQGRATPVYASVPISQEHPTGQALIGFMTSDPAPTGGEGGAAQPVTTAFYHTEASYTDVLNPLEIIGEDGDKTIRLSGEAWHGINFIDSGGGNNLIEADDYGLSIYNPQTGDPEMVDENAVGNFLYGSGDRDTLIGGRFDDVLAAANGDKLMMGGGGNNTYYLFQTAGHDKIINIGNVPSSVARNNMLVMPVGVALASLSYAWDTEIVTNIMADDGLATGGRVMSGQSIYRTLTLSWNVDSSVTIVLPHADQNSGLGGIDYVQFADGTQITFAALVQQAGGLPGIDPRDQGNTITLGAGDIMFDGGAGNDFLTAGTGHDTLVGGDGRDTLVGGSGGSVLIGGKARQLVSWLENSVGSTGATYYNDSGDDFIGGTGNDTIWAGSGADTFEFGLTGAHYTVASLHNSGTWGYYGPEENLLDVLGETFPLDNGLPIGADVLKFGAGISAADVTVSLDGSLTFTVGSNGQTVSFYRWRGWEYESLSQVQFADGTVWTREDIQAGFGDFDFTVGMGAKVITNVKPLHEISVDGALGIASLGASKVGLDLVLSDGEAGDSLTLKNWFADPLERTELYVSFQDGYWNNATLDQMVGYSSVFEFTTGIGHRTVTYAGNLSAVTVAAGLLPADVAVTRDGSDLLLAANNGADQLRIVNWYQNPDIMPALNVTFSDTTVLDGPALTALGLTVHASAGHEELTGLWEFKNVLIGDAADNVLVAGARGDTLVGGDGNDTLTGGYGDDLLQSGAGSSQVNGQQGADTYRVDLSGAGNTVIYDTGNIGASIWSATQDTLELPDGLTLGDLTYRVLHGSQYDGREVLEIHYEQAAVSLVFSEAAAWWQSPVGVQNIRLSDGTVLTRDEFMQQVQRVDEAPVLTIADQTLMLNQSVGAYALFGVADPENDPIVSYRISQAPGGTGYLTLNGYQQEPGIELQVDPFSFGGISFVGGGAAGSAQISIQAYDGISWSAVSTFTLYTQDLLRKTGWSSEALTATGDVFGLEGRNGDDTLTGSAANSYLNGGAGADTLIEGGGNSLLIGGSGNDIFNLGSGTDIVAFNQGDGQDVINPGGGTGHTLSLGGGVSYESMALAKDGDDLVLDLGWDDSLTFKDWYASSANRNFVNLQIVADATDAYDPASSNPLVDQKIESFDFAGLVDAFDAALAGNPGLTSWDLTNALLDHHLAGSDSAAVGGDLAYQYAHGNLTGIGVTPAQQVVQGSGFGTQAQTLRPLESLQQGLATLG